MSNLYRVTQTITIYLDIEGEDELDAKFTADETDDLNDWTFDETLIENITCLREGTSDDKETDED